MRVAMTGSGDGVTTVEIQILLPIAGVNPDALAARSGDWHLFIGRELTLFFAGRDLSKRCRRFHAHPALVPSGICFSGTANTAVNPSAQPMSNNMPSEMW